MVGDGTFGDEILILIQKHDFGTFGLKFVRLYTHIEIPRRSQRFNHSWDSFRKNSPRTLSPKGQKSHSQMFPSANMGMPYGKRGNIKEGKKTHPRELPLHSQKM
jgi:hypothetical protein